MALKKEQIEHIVALVKKGGLSNVAISKEVGCSESAVRTTIKKNNVIKNEIADLAKDEVQSIIMQDEIKTRKNELTNKERDMYDKVLITEIQSQNLALNANHLLLKKIHENIDNGKKLEKINVGDGVQHFEEVEHGSSDFVNHAKAIQTVTDSLGITKRHANQLINVNTQTNVQQNTINDIDNASPKEITSAYMEMIKSK